MHGSRWLKRTIFGSTFIGFPLYKTYHAIAPLQSDPEKSISIVSLPSFSSFTSSIPFIPSPSSSSSTSSVHTSESSTPVSHTPVPWYIPKISSSLYWQLWKINEGTDRLIRDIYTVIQIIRIYVPAIQKSHTEVVDWSLIHQQGADRLLKLCQVNKGIYIKLAQHIAQLQYLVPEPYVRTLMIMTHAAPRDSWNIAKTMLETELQQKYNNPLLTIHDIFETVNPEPIASASLAQVHVGYLRSDIGQIFSSEPSLKNLGGKKVAIKIQHPGLIETSHADIFTVVTLVQWVKKLFPKFNYEWLGYEVQRNVPLELNFLQEVQNSLRTKENFRHRQDVVIPDAYLPLCTSRLLIMSFEEGVYPTQLSILQNQMHLQRKDIAQLISEVFAEQIFFYGYCHCDPHQANLLVRPLPPNAKSSLHNSIFSYIPFLSSIIPSSLFFDTPKPQLVLLDHGLYRELSFSIRYNYAKLWRAIIFADEYRIEKYARRLSIEGEHYKLFASMLTTKKWATLMEVKHDVNILRSEGTTDEIQTISNDVRAYAEQIQELLGLLPRDLLLILKTNDCLRTIDWSLGTPINNFNVVARYTQKAIHIERANKKYKRKVNRYWKNIQDIVQLEWRLRMMNSAFSIYYWIGNFFGM